MTKRMYTEFASAERAPAAKLSEETFLFSKNENYATLDFVPDILLILNQNRQIIYANKALLNTFELSDLAEICGLRPGEALKCENALKNPEGGCGTSEFCRKCGAVNAILDALQGTASIKECRILTQDKSEALDLCVWATPIEEHGEPFVILFVKDISDVKRRKVLERIFFHDILNTAGAIKSTCDFSLETLKANLTAEEAKFMLQIIKQSVEVLIDDIMGQKQLTAAENGELKLKKTTFMSHDVLGMVKDQYHRQMDTVEAVYPRVSIPAESTNVEICTDVRLLRRVIENMTKNASEASGPSDTVSLECHENRDKGTVMFKVHNAGFIPSDVQQQIFHRSFSTKGHDRGIGTYSIKLLTERYLGGTVSFTSTPETGTDFRIEIPVS